MRGNRCKPQKNTARVHSIVGSFSIIRWSRKSEPSSACGRRNWMTSPRRLSAAPRRRPARSSPDHCKSVRRGAGRSDDAVTRNRRCINRVYPQKPGVTRLKTLLMPAPCGLDHFAEKIGRGLAVGSAPDRAMRPSISHVEPEVVNLGRLTAGISARSPSFRPPAAVRMSAYHHTCCLRLLSVRLHQLLFELRPNIHK